MRYDKETDEDREAFVRMLLKQEPNTSLDRLNDRLRRRYGSRMRYEKLRDLRLAAWADIQARQPGWKPAAQLAPRGPRAPRRPEVQP